METKIPLSVAIIAQDEAQNLPDCLKSVAFAEQIVVVDSGSADDTVRIARDFGCDVFQEPWRGGFGAQKQFAVDQCRHAWVLVLDADERIPPDTAAAIRQILANPADAAAGYSLPRKNFFQGRWIRHAGWWPDRVVRLFQKKHGWMNPSAVHEAVEIDGLVAVLNFPIEHLTESRLSKILLKIDRYSTLGAADAFAAGRTATAGAAVLRAILAFFHNYIIRLGMLDGRQGLTLAATDAINKYFKYAKLAEMTGKAKKYL